MLSVEAAIVNFIVLDLTRLMIVSMLCLAGSDHSNHFTTDGVYIRNDIYTTLSCKCTFDTSNLYNPYKILVVKAVTHSLRQVCYDRDVDGL